MQNDYDFESFTELGYRRLIRDAANHYAWRFFSDDAEGRSIIMRHDIDYSPQRAGALARIEAEEGAFTTYLLNPHSDFYNMLERDVVAEFRRIAALGHAIGLHFDMSFYGDLPDVAALEDKLVAERRLVESVLDRPCEVFSFHNPDTNSSLSFRQHRLGGMLNAYSETLASTHKYVSDSNGYWRFDNAFEVVRACRFERLHVLTHPEWWTPEAMSPRQRIQRAAQGRMDACLKTYDDNLSRWKRVNVR